MTDAFFALFDGLPRLAPGSDAGTLRLLDAVPARPGAPRILDLGCGTGRASLLLAERTSGTVTAVDLHAPYLEVLSALAASRGLAAQVTAAHGDISDLSAYADGAFDLVWSEGAAYTIGFDVALRDWRRLLAPGGSLVLTECEWASDSPSAAARAFWDPVYPLRRSDDNVAAARAAGYEVVAVVPVPDEDWYTEFYTPLAARVAAADPDDEATRAVGAEISLRRDHPGDYRYAGYVLRRTDQVS